MSKWWIVAGGLLVAVGFGACGSNAQQLINDIREVGDGNNTTDANTTTSDSNTTTIAPSPTPSVSTTPTPTCPTPANANDYFGSPRCCHTQARLCEDFESAAVGASPNTHLWTIAKSPNDTVQVSSTQAARGAHALHIHAINSGSQHAMIVNTSAFPFANNMFWGRAFVWFNSAYPSNHTTYEAAGPSPNPNYQWLRYSSFGNGKLGGNDSDPDNSSNSTQTLAHDAWSCIEWQYDVPNMKAYYYLNGQLISTLAIDAKHNGTMDLYFKQIEIGWELYNQDSAGGAAWDMYFDEIALDDKRIGCAN